MVIMRQSQRAFVERCDFRSSIGFGDGAGDRERLGLRGGGAALRHHRSRRARARPRVVRARADRAASRRDPSSRPRRRPAGRSASPTTSTATVAPTDDELRRCAPLPGGLIAMSRSRSISCPAGSCSAPAARREVAGEVERLGAERVMLIADAPAKARRRSRRSSSVAVWRGVGTRSPSMSPSSSPSGPEPRRAITRPTPSSPSAAARRPVSPRRSRLAPRADRGRAHDLRGSEQTTIYGLTGGQHKQTGKDPIVLPRVVVYDPELTLGLPPSSPGPSAFNALAHSRRGALGAGLQPDHVGAGARGRAGDRRSLPQVMAHPTTSTRAATCSTAPTSPGWRSAPRQPGCTTSSAMCSAGRFNLVHADAHSVILPHALAFNAPVLPDEMARLADALGAPGQDPAGALWDLAVASNVPTRAGRPEGQRRPTPARATTRRRRRGGGRDHGQPTPGHTR